MCIRKVRTSRYAIPLLLLLIALLAGCQPIARAPEKFLEKVDVWVDSHIILLGSHKAVAEASEALGLEPLIEGAEPLEVGPLIVNDYGQEPEQLLALLRQILETEVTSEQLERILAGDLVAQTFDLSKQELSVEAVIERVNSLRQEFPTEYDHGFIFAQPNFWVMPAVSPTQTICTGIGGAPHPSTIGGGAYGDPLPGATAVDFEQQNAFMQMTNNDPKAFTQGEAGAGVKIAIFDTSPFTSEVAGQSFTVIQLDEVIHLSSYTQPASVASHKDEHGLFVAGLARAAAPKSPLVLLRVLDRDTCGTLAGLNDGLFYLLTQTNKQEKLVMNLSLVYKLGKKPYTANEYLTQLLLSLATHRSHTVVVAAAGNEGLGQPTLYPAAYYTQMPLLAVASINQMGAPSCFSNDGSISAPGGEGVGANCDPSLNPADNLISVVTSPASSTNYAYWSGTSFAAPLVSGIAARCLSNGADAATTISTIDATTPGTDVVILGMCP